MKTHLRLGTRGSPLALFQAEEVRKKLLSAHATLTAELEIEVVPIRTGGDWRPGQQESSFRDIEGGKELFTKEIEEALVSGHIDMAVHSMKDVSSILPDNLQIAAVLTRVDPRDAFISRKARNLSELPKGSSVGTSSVRRQAQILAQRPDLRIVPLRGNVETRLKKLEDGMADATVLAMAGLIRLGLQKLASSIIEPDVMLPAAAQGAIGIETRRADTDINQLLAAINVPEAATCITAERALLRALDGSCHTPIGALAYFTEPNQIILEGMVARPDGTDILRKTIKGTANDAEKMGGELGIEMKSQLPVNFYAA